MSDYAKSATEDFVQAVRAEDIEMVARRLNSPVFKTQAREFISHHWDGKSDAEILCDLENIHPELNPGKWDVFRTIAYSGAIDLVAMPILHQVPLEAFQKYQYKWDSSSRLNGYETFLTALLRKRGLPKEHKNHLKTFENLPSFALHEPVSRKVVEDVPLNPGAFRLGNLDNPLLPDCKEAPWYDEYMRQIEGHRVFNMPSTQ